MMNFVLTSSLFQFKAINSVLTAARIFAVPDSSHVSMSFVYSVKVRVKETTMPPPALIGTQFMNHFSFSINFNAGTLSRKNVRMMFNGTDQDNWKVTNVFISKIENIDYFNSLRPSILIQRRSEHLHQ